MDFCFATLGKPQPLPAKGTEIRSLSWGAIADGFLVLDVQQGPKHFPTFWILLALSPLLSNESLHLYTQGVFQKLKRLVLPAWAESLDSPLSICKQGCPLFLSLGPTMLLRSSLHFPNKGAIVKPCNRQESLSGRVISKHSSRDCMWGEKALSVGWSVSAGPARTRVKSLSSPESGTHVSAQELLLSLRLATKRQEEEDSRDCVVVWPGEKLPRKWGMLFQAYSVGGNMPPWPISNNYWDHAFEYPVNAK